MRSTAALILAAAAALAPLTVSTVAAAAPATITDVTVHKISDGDTIRVIDADGREFKVRILGIDTPEVHNDQLECWGPEASQFAHDTLDGQRVTLVSDPTQDDVDRFGRSLRYVMKGSWDYSVEAARAGAARSYVYDRNPVFRYDQITAAEREAQATGRGVWGPACNGN